MTSDFLKRLSEGAMWEAWVASLLTRGGLYVLQYPNDGNENKDLTHPDMVVSRLEPSHCLEKELFEVEIKSLGLTFNNADTYPFERVLICSQSSFLRKWPGRDYICRDFLLVSQKTGSVVWVPAMTKVELGVEVHDSRRGESYKAVACKREDLRPVQDFIETVWDA